MTFYTLCDIAGFSRSSKGRSAAAASMVRAYSCDLRWRVIFLRHLREMTVKDIAETLLVSKPFVYKVLKRYEDSGNVRRQPPGSRPRLLTGKPKSKYI